MFVILVPVMIAALLALALGGSLRGLARPIAWWPLGVGAILAELALSRSPAAHQPLLLAWGHWAWTASLVCVLLVLARNARVMVGRERATWTVAAVGVALNLTAVVANGGYMPVAEQAAIDTGRATELATRDSYRRDVPVDERTRLPWLADVVPEPDWVPRASVLSIGDLLLIGGLAGWAFGVTLAGSRQAGLAPRRRQQQPV